MAVILEPGDAPDSGSSPIVIGPGDVFSGFLFEPEDVDVISFELSDVGADYTFIFRPQTGVLDYAVGEIQFPNGDYLFALTTFTGQELVIGSIPSPLRPTGT